LLIAIGRYGGITLLLLLSISHLFFLVAMILFSVSLSVRRGQNRARVGAMIAQRIVLATQLGQPLATSLAAAMAEERGTARQALLIIVRHLQDGAGLGSALHAARRWIDTRTVELLASAEHDGTLETAARRLAAQYEQRHKRPVGWLSPAYPLYLLMLMGLTCALFSRALVVPKIVQIQRDFRMPINPWLALINNDSAYDASLPIAIGIGALLIIVIGLLLGGRLGRHIGIETRRLWGWAGWFTPIVHRVVLSRGLADAMAGAADAVALGRPLPDSAALAGNRYFNHVLQRRLQKWAKEMDRGADAAAAARAAGLPDLVCGMLAPAVRSGTLAQTLSFLACYYESRFSRAAELLRGAIDCICIAAGAGVVLLVFATTLLPVYQLLDELSRNLGTGL
jgi:type II secretory pathway component PulF